ncbi:hypothetical protein QA640_07025 [Bradyrhizobium sp. CB82]|uniref:hypothetical protein n=1 Tax=Bradyrhizobium sp. CB82 TaxID=3039159 RepID=UPI0024B0F20A|nr:hypothetical protein [Bradyrhizobium sp. CB82]WFU42221.1 hypothetical protein QA640_07025 [Bradyrhizobium sp. CB82]
MSSAQIIDVWNVATFDPTLRRMLEHNSALIRDYLTTSRRQFLEREASDHRGVHPINPYAGDHQDLVEAVGSEMNRRTIRAWHYTRLVDNEVRNIQETGIYPGTLDTLRRRLEAQAQAGLLSAADVEALHAASPCHHPEQQPGRLGKFWLTSDPVRIDDGGVKPLLENWGGEATYFWLEDERLERLVAGMGRPRILEVGVPVEKTNQWLSAGRAVVGTFARTLGCRPDHGAFDLYTMEPLGPAAILAVHTAGESTFKRVGRGYPAEYKPIR